MLYQIVKPLLFRLGQLGAGFDETLPVAFENAHFLAGQAEGPAIFPECIDALEERLVLADLRIVPRHHRRDLALEMLNRVVGVGAGLVPEQRGYAGQFVPGDFKRRDGVGKGRGLGIAGNVIDLGIVRGESMIEGGLEVFVADCLETGQAMRSVPGEDGRIEGGLGHGISFGG